NYRKQIMDFIIRIRNFIVSILYKGLVKPLFFLMDPEDIHDKVVKFGNFLGRFWLFRIKTSFWFNYQNPILQQTILGINFKNPIGLAAGFDKDGYLIQILPSVGFGFMEIGSITGEPCEGNPRPWLWRLPKSQSLAVYYGLKNEGCEKIASRIKNQSANRLVRIPLGVSVAKANSSETVNEEKGIADYLKAYRVFVETGIGDYFTINISCPNVFGGEPFVEPAKLDKLLAAIKTVKSQKPIFVKLPADIEKSVIDEIISVSRKYKINGFICTNLTKSRSNPKIFDKNIPEKGGLSGKAVEELANNVIGYVYKKTRGEFVIIGCGGVFTAKDAYKKIKLGASLIQLITGMIFEGPQIISSINLGLVELLKKDGFTNIGQAVGKDNILN
ncbi:MAG: quinone-dependent dihydroorotate dehydrogenase, partial [Candidatus Doudnabacteria bacterium]|nr:quinone-dependent dihydroorotate dehydrogenase [Candidatus Doudnabacteria bacterium]